MAYFLPSYFQKRLLRYALTRLDLIETDDLNLEDLDITFGQRSVVELKNVGIKVDKLIDALSLPPTVILEHASIRRLRITVPADLHASGIVVEVDGVDIQVKIQEEDDKARFRLGSGPSHRSLADRARIPSPSIHDPGGYRHGNISSDHGHDHVIPTPRDLAKSFLETEPSSEREELEAALNSQSRMQESTASLASTVDERGMGMPGGFSLPGFVANFFAGVADRLSVVINNVEVVVSLQLSASGSPTETVKVMLRLAKASLGSLGTTQGSTTRDSLKRQVTFNGFEVLLLSEAGTFSQHSTTSSPKLSRSRSKASSVFSSEELSRSDTQEERLRVPDTDSADGSRRAPYISRHDTDSSDSSSSHLADLRPTVDDSLLESSDIFSHSSSQPYRDVDKSSELSMQGSTPRVDNQEHAEKVVAFQDSQLLTRSMTYQSGGSVEDLTASKMFTHDEAESMYMSAVSQTLDPRGMPGGWNDDEAAEQQEHSDPQPFEAGLATPTQPFPEDEPFAKDESPASIFTKAPGTSLAGDTLKEADRMSFRQMLETSKLVAKRLLSIDSLIFKLPASLNNGDESDERPVSPTSRTDSSSKYERIPRDIQSRHARVHGAAIHDDGLAASSVIQNTHARTSSREFTVLETPYQYEAQLGCIHVRLDMSIGRILVRTTSFVKKMISKPDTQRKATVVKDASKTGSKLSMRTKLKSLKIDICQSVPEITTLELQSEDQLKHVSNEQDRMTLLQLGITNFQHDIAQSEGGLRQKIIVERIELGQSDDKIMYFMDSINVRESINTSVMIKPYDLVIVNVNDRYEVSLKPVHIALDLLLVDDVLSRGGGLSSLLDLSSSIMSTGTMKEVPTKAPSTSGRPRIVRFDSGSNRPALEESPTPPQGLKIDIRISGCFVDIIGSETAIQLRTSAIKLVSRQSIFRAQIDTVALLGPLKHDTKRSADIDVKVVNLSLVYLDTPAEEDLDRLLSLLTPSGDKYDDEDDIMVDTLIRQRRKGGVMRLSTNDVQVNVKGMEWYQHVSRLGDELSKLSAVSKYLPEDDRPGVLTFGLINKISLRADLGGSFGMLLVKSALLEGAFISVPALMAAQLSTLSVERGEAVLLSEVVPNLQDTTIMGPPMLMCRFIADEMDPTVRLKLTNTQFEYTVPTLMAVMSIVEELKPSESHREEISSPRSSEISSSPSDVSDFARKVRFSLAVRNAAIALNPDKSNAKGLLLLSDAGLSYHNKQKQDVAQVDLRKASILIIDDMNKIGHGLTNVDHKLYFEENDQVQDLTKAGYVPVGSISNASALIKLSQTKGNDKSLLDVEFRNNLFLLETCADSTQTLIQIFSGLAPPSAPSVEVKYRTEIIPIQDMLASFTGNAFVTEPGPELGMKASHMGSMTGTSTEYDDETEDEDEEGYMNDMHTDVDDEPEDLAGSYLESEMSRSTVSGSVHIAPVNVTADNESVMGESIMAHSMLDFRTDHFDKKSPVGGTAHRWDSTRNTYGLGSEDHIRQSPLKIQVRDVHVIWNLFDGYDWQNTRDTISQAVQDIETKALSRQSRRDSKRSPGAEDDESVIGDFLFNSIYIGVPATKDPRDLTNAINQEIGDLATETGSYTTGTTVTAVPSGRSTNIRTKQKKLRLNRSRQHKLTFELKGVSADVLVFPPGSGEVESSIDIRVKQLEIFDHVPTSTWKKFATYMHEAGEREVDTSMIHIELLNVKPIAELAASEFVLKLTVLPLRLHVDQDALDFMTRFFEFKDDQAPVSTSPSAPPFFQRVEVNPIRLKLDFKPKRVDYGGLRSGKTTEFMNFFVLDRADMVLRRVILYGVSGLDRVGIMLNNIWSPDVRRNQLPGVLAGLAPIRSLVDVGSGVKDLVAVPIREYKKDGRIVRSIQKGAIAFAKTTTTELVNLGAKLAIGTQTVLQNAEEMLVPREQSDDDEERKEQISLYADQPLGIVQGLRGAYASLERDLLLAKDAIVAVPGEVMASGSAAGAAKAVLKQSPTIILRPAIGATKAVGQTLLGAGNTLDRTNLRRIEEKYKRHF